MLATILPTPLSNLMGPPSHIGKSPSPLWSLHGPKAFVAQEAQSSRVGPIESTVVWRGGARPAPPAHQSLPWPVPFPSSSPSRLFVAASTSIRFAPLLFLPSEATRNQTRAPPPPRKTERKGSALLFPDTTPPPPHPPTPARSAGCPGCRFLGKPRGHRPSIQFRSLCDPGRPAALVPSGSRTEALYRACITIYNNRRELRVTEFVVLSTVF